MTDPDSVGLAALLPAFTCNVARSTILVMGGKQMPRSEHP